MSSLTIFIHGIGSDKKVWKEFIKVQKSDNNTNTIKEYSNNITNIEVDTRYFYLYEYDSKKLNLWTPIKFFNEKMNGTIDSGEISINKHMETFKSKIHSFSDKFESINIVAHSMGGIITIKMLFSFLYKEDKIIEKCLLYGAPLKGSANPSDLQKIFGNKITSNVLKELDPESITITSLIQQFEYHSSKLKQEYDITFISGDTDARIVEIKRNFVESFGSFESVAGNHSDIVKPKNMSSDSFTIYKNLIIKKKSKKLNLNTCDLNLVGIEVFQEYIKNKIIEFSKERNNKYLIKENMFVNIFDLIVNGERNDLVNNLDFFSSLIKKNAPIFLLASYGMGKSTTAKQLFNYINNNTDKSAIFINLHLKCLEEYYEGSINNGILENKLTAKIFEEIIATSNKNNEVSNARLVKYYTEELKMGNIILVFDGLDEVNIRSHAVNDKVSVKNEELDNFFKTIFNQKTSIFLTCRKEYSPFYHSYSFYKKNKLNYEIEFCEWEEKQWASYFNALEKDSPSKELSEFKKDIFQHKYIDLPKRPLFLSMLTELRLNKKNDYSSHKGLSTNLAEIYNQYIDLNLNHDIEKKSQELKYSITNKSHYKSVWKKLLVELAYHEYQSNKKISLSDIVNIAKKLDSTEKYYQQKFIHDVLETSSQFSIIHREYNSNEFSFSHKSFLEYLISYKLANDIFVSNVNDSFCNESWKMYQTSEIHHLFMEEILRVAVYKNIIDPSSKKMNHELLFENKNLEHAFKSLLVDYDDKKAVNSTYMLSFFEDYQAVLYYVGKFRIKALKLFLTDILDNEDNYHSIYFRTVSLSLSTIENDKRYCDNYVRKIIDNFLNTDEGLLFYENINIQKKYHGLNVEKLRSKLNKNLDNFKTKVKIENNISLIILTYYATFVVSYNEIATFKDELIEIKKIANELNLSAVSIVCDSIPKIWKKMSSQYLDSLIG